MLACVAVKIRAIFCVRAGLFLFERPPSEAVGSVHRGRGRVSKAQRSKRFWSTCCVAERDEARRRGVCVCVCCAGVTHGRFAQPSTQAFPRMQSSMGG